MRIEFLASIALITPDQPASRRLYADVLGVPLEGAEPDGYQHTEAVEGAKHFGVWPLSQAAEACFATPEWPADRPIPQVSVEFDVADAEAVADAARELDEAGYELLHPPREEPWGQIVVRMQSPEGAIVGVSHTPALRD